MPSDAPGRPALARARASLGAKFGTLVAQLFFIAAGVYIGNRADEWRQVVEHRKAARAALETFRAEMVENRQRVRVAAPVHRGYLDSMDVAARRGGPPPATVSEAMGRLGWHGLVPVSYAHTAWELALATQSLAYLPRPLAFRIADVYQAQEDMERMQNQATGSLFTPASFAPGGTMPFLIGLRAYLEDATIWEPRLARAYDRMIPALDSAIARLPR